MMNSAGALAGVRVLDFTQYYAGPVATHHLALVGADVIKVEPLTGDSMRFDGDDAWAEAGLAPGFVAFNLSKRSIALDLRTEEGRDVARRLANSCDVLCENFRPGVMTRLGLDYAALRDEHPELIYCSVSGFGADGPEATTPAFDGKIQAMTGLMSISGDDESGPMRTGVAIADILTGITAAFAITAAINQRNRTGEGQLVDVSMYESMLSVLSDQVAAYTMRDEIRTGAGNLSITKKPTADRFATSDGYVVLAALTDAQFDALLDALELSHLTDDPRFVSWPERIRHGDALRQAIQDVMLQRTTTQWIERLTAAGVPFGPVLDVAQALDRPQLDHRQFLRELQTPVGSARVAGQGFRLAGGGQPQIRFAPTLGQHTTEVLTDAGYDAAEINRLRDAAAIG